MLAFATSLAKNRHKFDSRAKRLILGHPFGMKGYKLLDLETKRIFVSWNVTFHENVFPYIVTILANTKDIPDLSDSSLAQTSCTDQCNTIDPQSLQPGQSCNNNNIPSHD